jgi:hypothetical protein
MVPVISGFVFTAFLGALTVQAAPSLVPRQSITTLTPAQVSAFKPYTYYASTAYCKPAATLAWNCGGEFLHNVLPKRYKAKLR